jgi:hypothetical protein
MTGSTSRLKPLFPDIPSREKVDMDVRQDKKIGIAVRSVDRKRDSGRYFPEKAVAFSRGLAFFRNSFGGMPACLLKALLKTDFELNPAS